MYLGRGYRAKEGPLGALTTPATLCDPTPAFSTTTIHALHGVVLIFVHQLNQAAGIAIHHGLAQLKRFISPGFKPSNGHLAVRFSALMRSITP